MKYSIGKNRLPDQTPRMKNFSYTSNYFLNTTPWKINNFNPMISLRKRAAAGSKIRTVGPSKSTISPKSGARPRKSQKIGWSTKKRRGSPVTGRKGTSPRTGGRMAQGRRSRASGSMTQLHQGTGINQKMAYIIDQFCP